MKRILFCYRSILGFLTVLAEEKACVRDIETYFFNPIYVSQALSLHDVSQSAWSQVNLKLRERNSEIPKLVMDKVSKMDPNPLRTPFDPREAAKVLEEALFEMLASVLTEFNIENPLRGGEMFNYIREQQNSRFIDCFGAEENKMIDKSVQKNKP